VTARNIGLIAFFTVAPAVAFGQETGPQPAPAPQPSPAAESHLTMERIQNGFVIAPDNRFTDVDGRYANLLGFYGGWMMDRTFLIGAGGYWLTNGSHDQEMSYGGAVVEWLVHGDRRLGFSARALIGGGSASLPGTLPRFPIPMPYPFPAGGVPQLGHGPDHDGFWGGWDLGRGWPPNGTVRLHDGFFVAEPQVNVSWKVKKWLHVTAGGGYRLITGTRNMDSRLDGVSGSLSVQIGGGR
jgi:hypothetical protein